MAGVCSPAAGYAPSTVMPTMWRSGGEIWERPTSSSWRSSAGITTVSSTARVGTSGSATTAGAGSPPRPVSACGANATAPSDPAHHPAHERHDDRSRLPADRTEPRRSTHPVGPSPRPRTLEPDHRGLARAAHAGCAFAPRGPTGLPWPRPAAGGEQPSCPVGRDSGCVGGRKRLTADATHSTRRHSGRQRSHERSHQERIGDCTGISRRARSKPAAPRPRR